MESLSENVRISVTILVDGQILATELESEFVIKNIITQCKQRSSCFIGIKYLFSFDLFDSFKQYEDILQLKQYECDI